MTNTVKTVIIASASSIVSSTIVGFVCYVKGKQSGIKVRELPNTAEQNKKPETRAVAAA